MKHSFKPRKKRNIKIADLIEDLQRVSTLLQSSTVPCKQYEEHGYFSSRPYIVRFGTWNKALIAAELDVCDKCSPKTRFASGKLRYKVMQRDNFKCILCGHGASDGIKLHVDHIIPFSKGGKTIPENLQTLCHLCNCGKGVSS